LVGCGVLYSGASPVKGYASQRKGVQGFACRRNGGEEGLGGRHCNGKCDMALLPKLGFDGARMVEASKSVERRKKEALYSPEGSEQLQHTV